MDRRICQSGTQSRLAQPVVVAPIPFRRETKTGRVRPRIGLFRRVVMQIEVSVEVFHDYPSGPVILSHSTYWRDACHDDVSRSVFAEVK